MRILWLLLLVTTLVYIGFVTARFAMRVTASKNLPKTTPYIRSDGAHSILVLGDSTAVGVGSTPEKSVAGRLSGLIDASVENNARSGATTADLAAQLASAQRKAYDMILIQVGANDVMYFRSLDEAQLKLAQDLQAAHKLSPRVLVLTAGDIGNAPIFPWPVSVLLTERTKKLRDKFILTTKEQGAVYVDLYAEKDPFDTDHHKYYAADMLHLSSEGYGFWFSIVQKYVEKNWPELIAHP